MRVLISVLIMIGIAGCKNVECPAFPEQTKKYFPYQLKDSLVFKNLYSDTLVVRIVEMKSTDEYSFNSTCDCSCEASFSFNTSLDSGSAIQIDGIILFYKDNNTSVLMCRFIDPDIGEDVFSSFSNNHSNPFQNDSVFGDTLILENNNYERISRVKIVNGQGIIEFRDTKKNCLWTKIN
jgi:hypothetical protein